MAQDVHIWRAAKETHCGVCTGRAVIHRAVMRQFPHAY
jgi:hypothetical protein